MTRTRLLYTLIAIFDLAAITLIAAAAHLTWGLPATLTWLGLSSLAMAVFLLFIDTEDTQR